MSLAAYALIDYQRGLNDRLRDQELALSEEAALVLPAVIVLQHHGDDAVQDYIDRACAQTQQSVSPGHHIVVITGDKTYEAQTHPHSAPALDELMRRLILNPGERARIGGKEILVGHFVDGDVEVYISEFADNTRRAARERLLTRIIATAIIFLILTIIVNAILIRLIIQPIGTLTQAVRRIAGGHLGFAPPPFFTSELAFLSNEIGEMSRSLDSVDRDRRLQMQKARTIQQNLLPQSDQLKRAGVDHAYIPAEEVGGDFLEVKTLQDGRVVVCLGDVTGHGVPAAVSAAMLKVLFQEPIAKTTDPAAVLEKINQRFYEVTLDGDFATLFMCIVDRAAGKLTYASAGHEVGYLVRSENETIELPATGLLLGVDPDATYRSVHLGLQPTDKIVLLTDGLAESMSANGDQLGRHTLLRAMKCAGRWAPAEIIARLKALGEEHRGDQVQFDDITLVALDCQGLN